MGAGTLTGIAILFRSVAQFWPLVMIIVARPYLNRDKLFHIKTRQIKKKLLTKVICAVLIAFAIASIWIVRNSLVHGIPTLSSTPANGSARVITLVLERRGDRPPDEVWQEWKQEYMAEHKLVDLSIEDDFRFCTETARRTLYQHPWETFEAYISLVWENLNDINYTHRLLYPDYKGTTIALEYKIKGLYLNYVSFCLSMIGLSILLITRRYQTFALLAGVYLYYALTIGFGRWQGSRLFFPGQIAWSILIGVVITYVLDLVKIGLRSRHQS